MQFLDVPIGQIKGAGLCQGDYRGTLQRSDSCVRVSCFLNALLLCG